MTEHLALTAEQGAIQAHTVERTNQSPTADNATFEALFGNPGRNPFRGWNPDPRTIHGYQFVDVVLDGDFRGLFNAEGYIRGTGYLVGDDHMATLSVDAARLVPSSADGTVIIGCNTAYAKYFHWITQSLPAIDYAVNRIGQAPRISVALPPLEAWQEDSLRLLDLSTVRRITIPDKTRQYAFHRAEYSEFLNGGSAFSQSATARATFARLRKAVERPASTDRKIYVPCTDKTSLIVRKEEAIIEDVRKRNFEVIAPGSLPLAEQISLFRGASLVVGSHGADLTNIVFCEPGTIVYELVPAHYTNACFCNLALICGLRYWADAFASEGEGLPHVRDWEPDMAAVVERLDEIEAIHATLQEEAKRRTISALDYLRGMPGKVAQLELAEEEPAPERPGLFRRIFGAGRH
jgi:capsular polysaccharide biosynthesis protein